MTMPSGLEFKGAHSYNRISVNGTDASIAWAHWINQYCNMYKYNGLPLDADYVAALLSTENASWTYNGGSTDYATTHSAGLGQFRRIPHPSTGDKYGVITDAQAKDPETNIKAICHYYCDLLIGEHGIARNGYKAYNGGPAWRGDNQRTLNQIESNAKRFDSNLLEWQQKGNGPIIKAPVNTAANKAATDAANAKKKADDIAHQKVVDAQQQKSVKQAQADKAAIEKAKATNDANKIKDAQNKATANANAIKKAQADTLAKKAKTDKDNAIAIKNAQQGKSNTTVKATTPNNKVFKSGIGLIGLLAIFLIFKDGYIPKETF